MSVLQHLEPKDVFHYFEEISAIPRGSGDRDAISAYCIKFASEHSLRYVTDEAKNVIIYKDATAGYEASAPVILQGHLDMVCQKTAESEVDFLRDGIKLKVDGDIVSAVDTTLGADNGIAVAMMLAILASTDVPHPPLEAVFTVDEEVGMLGAVALDTSLLSGRRMINIDSEEEDSMTVSCAGGSEFLAKLPVTRHTVHGTEVTITARGLRGGHSGICINEGGVNANLLAGRILKTMEAVASFELISVDGGDKSNAIPNLCEIRLCTADPAACASIAKGILAELEGELSSREPDFAYDIEIGEVGDYDVLDANSYTAIVHVLVCTPNGVIDMSADIEGLVETSLNLGILKTNNDEIECCYALRSNKKTALRFLEARMSEFYRVSNAQITVSGAYPPWEYSKDSVMQGIYQNAFYKALGKEVRVEAIHAGLECAVFADTIPGLDCIAIGPAVIGAHTVGEHLSASSAHRIYSLLKAVLRDCK